VTRAIGEMQAKGRVSAQEMRQLADAGLPVWDALARHLSTVMGRTVSVAQAMKMAEDNVLSARDGIASLLSLSERYAGMADKLGQSTLGLFSTLKDNASLALRDLGNAIVQAFDLKGVMRKLSDLFGFLRANIDSIKPALVEIGTAFKATFDIAISLVKLAVEALKDWAGQVGGAPKGLQEMRNAIVDVMEAIGKAVITTLTNIANEAISIINKIRNPGRTAKEAALAAGPALGGWFARLLGFTDPTRPRAAPGGTQAGPSNDIAALDPAKAIAGMQAFLDKLRQGGLGVSNLVGAIGGGLVEAIRHAGTQAGILNVQFGQFPNGIQNALDKAETFGKKLADIQMQFRQLIPHQQMLQQMDQLVLGATALGGALAGAARVGGEALQRALGALHMQAGRVLQDMRAKFGPKNVDVGAMVKGSQEAASAINRAINESKMPSGDPTVEELRMLRAIELEQNRILERQGQRMLQLWGQIGIAGP